MKTDLIQPKSREAENELSTIEKTVFSDYKYGFITHIEADEAPKGLNEDVIRFISARKKEPQWMLDWRLKAYRHWLTMKSPEWANIKFPPINYQDIIYYSAPKQKINPKNLEEIDPELIRTFEKLGISLDEQKRLTGVAVCRSAPPLKDSWPNSESFFVP
jgi:Fe-S cluster assembly protein SufB